MPIYSGYSSIAAIKEFNGKTTKMTKEHYNSRTRMAHVILDKVIAGETADKLVFTIKEAVKVHYTTKTENQLLTKHQRSDEYDWKTAYEKVGIQLVPFSGIKRWYQIDGIKFYKSKKDLQLILNVGKTKLERIIEDSGEDLVVE